MKARRRPAGALRFWRPAVVLAGVTLLATALTWLRPVAEVEGEYLVFGSRARIVVHARDRERADAALSAIGRQLAEDHRRWHAWEPSELTRLNETLADGRSGEVDAGMAEMIRQAQRGYVLSDGLFNPAAGRLIGAWGFHTGDYPVRTAAPAAPRIAHLMATAPAMNDVEVDGTTVRSRNPSVSLDLNGLAEGYASLQVQQVLAEHDLRDALVYIGGFVLALGQDRGNAWRVGVRGPQGLLGTVGLRDGEALSSSGDYLRRRNDGGGHIVDPRAGRPQRRSAAASVLSDDPVLADMAATALMVAGESGFDRLARRMGLGCALLVTADGRLHLTRGMEARLQGLPSRSSRTVHAGAGTDCDAPRG